jgi:hypothetical protein
MGFHLEFLDRDAGWEVAATGLMIDRIFACV